MSPFREVPSPRGDFKAPLTARSRAVARAITGGIGAFALIAGVISFSGWMLDLPRLARWFGGEVYIQPNTAVAVAIAGLGLILSSFNRTLAASVAGLVVLFVGMLLLSQWLTHRDLGIDGLLLFGRTWGDGQTARPGRVGLPASACLTLFGLGMLTAGWNRKPPRTVPICALALLFVTSVSIAGFIFGAGPLYAIPTLTTIAPQTALFLCLLGIGLLYVAPEREPTRTLLASGAAGVLIRRMLPVTILVPLGVSIISVYGIQQDWFDEPTGNALRVTVVTTTLCILLWMGARAVASRERTIIQRESLLSGVLGSVRDAFFALDSDWRFTLVSEELLKRTRKTRTDLLGKVLWEVFPDTLGTVAHHSLQRAMRERVTAEFEMYYAPLNVWVWDKAFPTPDGGLVVYSQDVTDRKESERTLSEQRQLLQSINNTVPDYVYVKDRTGRITYANPAVINGIGLPADRIVGHLDSEFLADPENARTVMATDRRIMESGEGEMVEETLDLPTGRFVFLSAKIPLRDDSGKVTGLIGISRDITQRKQMEQELREANIGKDVFLATLSHEMRTPLAAVLGWAAILRTPGCSDADLTEGLEVIDRNANALSKLIEDVLDVSRIVSGKLRLDLRSCDIVRTLHDVVQIVQPLADEKSISLRTHVEPDLSVVLCDSARLQQIISNLLTNAIKFTPTRGSVDVKLFAISPERTSIRLEVTDSGIGIPAEFLPYVFDRFRQADGSPKRRFGGLGLGLSIVRQLTALHGGTVRATSAGDGKGSTFTVDLPVCPPTVKLDGELRPTDTGAAVRSEDRSIRDGRHQRTLDGVRIVVVDDDNDARRLVSKVLTDVGATVFAGSSVREGINLVETHRPHVVVSDVAMPEEDGYDFVRRLRAAGHDPDRLPVIALTAFAGKNYAKSAITAGFQVHLAKPVDARELIRVIENLSSRAAVASQSNTHPQ
jgi:PAS domain S-box-containing protein